MRGKSYRAISEDGKSFEFNVTDCDSFDRRGAIDLICEDARSKLSPGTVFEIRERINSEPDLEGNPRRNIVGMAWYTAVYPSDCPQMAPFPYRGRPLNMNGCYLLLAAFVA